MTCEHKNIRWISGAPSVAIVLNGDVAAVCLDCGAEGRLNPRVLDDDDNEGA